jgi:hypothetical protein
MEIVEGKTLEQIVEASFGFLSEKDVINWAIQLCNVLEYLHKQTPPIVFRDIKPSNIMLNNEGQIKLIDFGIARLFNPAKSKDTVAMGTVGYAPPEQYGKGQSEPRSDIYALGATLYHLITKHDPLKEPPFFFSSKPIKSFNPNVSDKLAKVILKATQTRIEDRFSSAEEMASALRTILPVSRILPSRPSALAPYFPPHPEPRSLNIPLHCTLEDAKRRFLRKVRQPIVESVVYETLLPDPLHGKVILLIGDNGVGTTEITQMIRNELAHRQREFGLIAAINLSSLKDATFMLQQIIERLKLVGKLHTSGSVRLAVEKGYKKALTLPNSTAMRSRLKIQSPITFNFGPIPTGSIGDKPMEFEYERNSTTAPISQPDLLELRKSLQDFIPLRDEEYPAACGASLLGLRFLIPRPLAAG